MDKMRQEFEAWFSDEYGCKAITYSDGRYVMDSARRTWKAWQASRDALRDELKHAVFSEDKHGSGLILSERVFKAIGDDSK